MEQIRLENEQIEVTVNIHGAELRSLKSKADGQEYLWNADAKYWGYIDPERWNGFYAWLDEKGLTEEEIPSDAGFSNDYLPGQDE